MSCSFHLEAMPRGKPQQGGLVARFSVGRLQFVSPQLVRLLPGATPIGRRFVAVGLGALALLK